MVNHKKPKPLPHSDPSKESATQRRKRCAAEHHFTEVQQNQKAKEIKQEEKLGRRLVNLGLFGTSGMVTRPGEDLFEEVKTQVELHQRDKKGMLVIKLGSNLLPELVEAVRDRTHRKALEQEYNRIDHCGWKVVELTTEDIQIGRRVKMADRRGEILAYLFPIPNQLIENLEQGHLSSSSEATWSDLFFQAY